MGLLEFFGIPNPFRKKRAITIEEKVAELLAMDRSKLGNGYDITKFDVINFLTKEGYEIVGLNSIQNVPGYYFDLTVDFKFEGSVAKIHIDWFRSKIKVEGIETPHPCSTSELGWNYEDAGLRKVLESIFKKAKKDRWAKG